MIPFDLTRQGARKRPLGGLQSKRLWIFTWQDTSQDPLAHWPLDGFGADESGEMGKPPTQLASVPTTASSGKLGESKGVKELASWPVDFMMGEFSSSCPPDFKKNNKMQNLGDQRNQGNPC